MLCSMHLQSTLSDKPPFFYTADISRVNRDRLDLVLKDESFTSFTNACAQDFLKLGLPYGSVHMAPNAWIKIVLDTLRTHYNRTTTRVDTSGVETSVQIPNGCCNVPTCPLNQFYQIVINNLSS